jgi:ygbB family
MCKCLSDIIGCDIDAVSIKATTSERMGFVGREDGMAAYAVCMIVKA